MSQENLNAQEGQETPPTKEEVIKFFQEQIEVKKVQLELQELNTRLAVGRAEEMKALSFIGQMTNPRPESNPYQGGTPHILTEEDLQNNPELAEQGLKVGDEVLIPKEEDQPKEKRSLKKNK